jgi:UDP-glucose:(heptosyl)LPS alpha-1,3-glucosyltransferase
MLRDSQRGSILRIAIVIERFVPQGGGVENVAWQIAHELERQGERVCVLAREVDPAASVPVTHVPAPRFWQPLRIPLFSLRCRTELGRGGWDVVHGFSHTHTQDLFRAGGGCHRDELRRLHMGAARAVRWASPRHRVRLAIERHVFERTRQRIQCSSRLVADAIEREHGVAPERIDLLPNAVDAERFSAESARRAGHAMRKRLAPTAERVWLFPGSGWHRKGLDTALAAFAAAEPRNDAQLWVAGRDTPTAAAARSRELGVHDRVRFLGACDDMPALYQAADAVLLPTRYDPFANVTIEAAAAGRPIVTSGANGAAEWFGDAINRVEQAEDVHGFAQAIRALRGASERARRGAALARTAAGMDWPAHVGQLRGLYARIVAERGPLAATASQPRRNTHDEP